jgi:DNA invertase Pin-like site-specific DNA recombinase
MSINIDDENVTNLDNRAVGYIRVSDESQINGYSLEAQKLEIERWSQRKGFTLIKVYTEAGVTAHTDQIENRPELVQLLRDAKQGMFGVVLVHTLDRWARRLIVQQELLRDLAKARVGFASVTENFDATTPHGRLMLNQMGSYNQYFSELLKLHVRKAFRYMAETGIGVGAVPFGYKRQHEKKLPPLKVEHEVAAVKEIFNMRTEGHSYGEVAAWLNHQGFRSREGNAFTAHAIRDILDNRFYCGFIKYKGKKYLGKHEPIIADEVFQRVQSKKQNRQPIRAVHGPHGLLQGLVACSHCGNKLQSDRHYQRVPLYRERHAHECPTNETSIVAEVIDKQVATIVHALQILPDWKLQMVKIATTGHDGPKPEELKEKRRRLGKAYADGAFTDNEYKTRLAEIDNQIAQTSVTTPPDIEDAIELFSNLPMLWNEATINERRALLRSLVELVYVDIRTKRVTAIKPTPAFKALYGIGINTGPNTPVKLEFRSETPILVELVETGENQTPPETRECRDWDE